MGISRSENMSRIRSRNTGPEQRLAEALAQSNLDFRVGIKIGRIRPDITSLSERIAVFVDGCFWHGCPDHYVRPKASGVFWAAKLRENVTRDIKQTEVLERENWKVVRVWEHEVMTKLEQAVSRIKSAALDPLEEHWRVIEATPISSNYNLESRILVELRGILPDAQVVCSRTTAKW